MANLVSTPGERVEVHGVVAKPELNGLSGVVHSESAGRVTVKLENGAVVSLKPENLRPPSYFATLTQMFDFAELRHNWNALRARAEPYRAKLEASLPPAAKPAARSGWTLVALVVLVFAVLTRGGPGGGACRPAAAARATSPDDLYALGYADARAARAYGHSLPGFKTSAETSREGSELLDETLRDAPAEDRGVREEWEHKTGWNRREDMRMFSAF